MFIMVPLKFVSFRFIKLTESLSKFEVASSKNSISGLRNRALIRDTFCICPDERDLEVISSCSIFFLKSEKIFISRIDEMTNSSGTLNSIPYVKLFNNVSLNINGVGPT